MQPFSVVVAHHDPAAAASLASCLREKCRAVPVTSRDEVRSAIVKNRADVAVVDLELLALEQVKDLCSEFHKVAVVCTHRLADEELWARALNIGAADCCLPSDVKSVVSSICNGAMVRSTAA